MSFITDILGKVIGAISGWKRIAGYIAQRIVLAIVGFCSFSSYCKDIPIPEAELTATITFVLLVLAEVLQAIGVFDGIRKNAKVAKD